MSDAKSAIFNKALGIGGGLLALWLVYKYVKGEVKSTVTGVVKDATVAAGKAADQYVETAGWSYKYIDENSPRGLISQGYDSIFSGIRATFGMSEPAENSNTGIIIDTVKDASGRAVASVIPSLNPALDAVAWLKDWFGFDEQEDNPKNASGVPLLLQKPIVYPKESQAIVDKTLQDSFLNYTGKK